MPTITKSIGTAARDYSTITLWEADLDNALVYAPGDGAVGECYNDSAFDETFTIDGGGVIGLNSVKLSVAVGQRHNGTAGTGARIVRTGVGTVMGLVPLAGTMKLIVEWLEINDNGQAILITISASGATAGRVPVCKQMIVHDSINTAANFVAVRASGRDILMMNNIIYDFVATSNNRPATGMEMNNAQANGGILNNTVFKITGQGTGNGIGINNTQDNANGKCRNNISVSVTNNSPACFLFAGAVNIVSTNNLSDDATADDGGGTGNIINATLADIFVSTTNGSEDLHLKRGSPAIDTGVDLATTPTGVQFDIDNFDRDTSGVIWDIGADEFTGGNLGGTLPYMGVG